jgi:hypothetical protein
MSQTMSINPKNLSETMPEFQQKEMPARYQTVPEVIGSVFTVSIPGLFQNDSPFGLWMRRLTAISFGLLSLSVILHMNWGLEGVVVFISATALIVWRVSWSTAQADSWFGVLHKGLPRNLNS